MSVKLEAVSFYQGVISDELLGLMGARHGRIYSVKTLAFCSLN